jgi:hypothetical protein
MNVTESCAVNNLLNWLLRTERSAELGITQEQACDAAACLAAHAHKQLGAGIRPEDVRARFSRLFVSPPKKPKPKAKGKK